MEIENGKEFLELIFLFEVNGYLKLAYFSFSEMLCLARY